MREVSHNCTVPNDLVKLVNKIDVYRNLRDSYMHQPGGVKLARKYAKKATRLTEYFMDIMRELYPILKGRFAKLDRDIMEVVEVIKDSCGD